MVITKNRKASDARPEPIGVKFLTSPVDVPDHPPVFQGTSFCQAVHQASSEALLLSEGSIDTCRGSPVVLGLTAPGNGFERGLEPRLEDTWGVYLANLTSFGEKGLEPDVVILRDTPQNLGILVEAIGEAGCAMQYAGQTDKSALTIFFGGK